MRRFLLICLFCLFVLGAALAAAWFLLQDEEFLEARLRALVLSKTGRDLAIDGALHLDLGPESIIEVHGIRLQNAAWADGDDMLTVGHLKLALELRSLFSGTPVISVLLIEDCQLLFATSADGASNWQLRPDSADTAKDEVEPGLSALLRDGQVRNCRLRFESPQREEPLELAVDTLAVELLDGERLRVNGAGRVNREALSLSGQLAPVSALAHGGPLQYEVSAQAGDISLHSSGAFQDVRSGQGADLDMRFSGPEVARLLHYFGLPDLSQGAFDFRLDLDTQGPLTRVDLDGDLGSLQARAEGELDRLSRPTKGRLNGVVTGPDLEALGRSLGVSGLAAEAYELQADIGFESGLVRVQALSLASAGDQLTLSGVLGTDAALAGSDLEFTLALQQAARLAAVFGKQLQARQPLALSGRLQTDADGRAGLRAQAQYHDSSLTADGTLGPKFRLAGSEFEIQLETPDLGALALSFDRPGLPHEPLRLELLLKSEGEGLLFRSRRADSGNVRLEVDGRIADLSEPHGVDARFDISLPSLAALDFLAPGLRLPDLPLAARGQLHSSSEGTRLEGVELNSGAMRASLGGRLLPGKRFDLTVQVVGPSAAELERLAGVALPPEPFTLQAQLAGSTEAFELTALEAQLGESRAGGDLAIRLGAPRRIAGTLRSPLLDLSPWTGDTEGPQAAPEPASAARPAFVFDDTPVTRITDYGLELDLDLGVERLDLGHSQLRDVQLGVRLDGQRLGLEPFALRGAAGGLLSGRATLDDSGDKPRLELELFGQDLRLGLAAIEGQDSSTIPATEIHLELTGSGATQREMASGLNGRLRLYQGPGQIASAGVQFLFSDFLSELLNLLNPFAEKTTYTQLDCAVAAADIVDGLATVSPVVFNTRQITIFSQGSVDLRTERLDLSFNTKPRQGIGLSTGVVINPFIKVGGRLAEPAIELDPRSAAVSGGAAVATAGLTLLAKSFSDRFLSSRDPCGDARREIEERDR
jgi:AsmA family protein